MADFAGAYKSPPSRVGYILFFDSMPRIAGQKCIELVTENARCTRYANQHCFAEIRHHQLLQGCIGTPCVTSLTRLPDCRLA
jgi:hypothetical protein